MKNTNTNANTYTNTHINSNSSANTSPNPKQNRKTSHKPKPTSPSTFPRASHKPKPKPKPTSSTPHLPTSSKLSLGPKNPHHKLYRRNERAINKALCYKLSKRQINVKARELYRDAGITPPTFYLHYRNPDDAKERYEKQLTQDFQEQVPTNSKKDVIYAVLTSYIAKNKFYFLAVVEGKDHYVLEKILRTYRSSLVGNQVSDQTFCVYVGVVISIIIWWLEQDKITPESVKYYGKFLAKVKPMRWW